MFRKDFDYLALKTILAEVHMRFTHSLFDYPIRHGTIARTLSLSAPPHLYKAIRLCALYNFGDGTAEAHTH